MRQLRIKKGEAMKKFMFTLLGLLLVGTTIYVLANYWPYIFSRKVQGVVADVQRIYTPVALIGGGSAPPTKELFSFAIAIKEESGEIVTASSEDRQWAVVKNGLCAEARFYPYPPWDFDKSGTYFNARLVRLNTCDTGQLVPTTTPPEESAGPGTNPQETSPQEQPIPDTSNPQQQAVPQ